MYPLMFLSQSTQKLPVDLAQFGCIKGSDALNEILLDQISVKNPNPTIEIHKRMDIFKNGTRKFRLDEQITKPGSQFIVKSSRDYDESLWIVSLKNPKSLPHHRRVKRKSETVDYGDEMAYCKRRKTENLFLSRFHLALKTKYSLFLLFRWVVWAEIEWKIIIPH